MAISDQPKEISKTTIVVGCNYHTKWQNNAKMRFVLSEIKGDKARLTTRITNKNFWTNVSDLVFIMTPYNIDKAIRLSNGYLVIDKSNRTV